MIAGLLFLYGGLTVMCFIAGLFFLRYRAMQRDPLFGWFALAFWCFGASWCVQAIDLSLQEEVPYVYVLRLVGFVLIILAILGKNRPRSSSG